MAGVRLALDKRLNVSLHHEVQDTCGVYRCHYQIALGYHWKEIALGYNWKEKRQREENYSASSTAENYNA
jgi:hypothetical protein